VPLVVPNPRRVKAFANEAAFERWIAVHHDSEREIWVKIHKKGSGLPSVTPAHALDVCLCWGWIDGLRKAFDERSFLQRYTPRGPKSRWSQINRGHVARLTSAGRMTPQGQRQVDAAKADGRWNAAYASIANTTVSTVPVDLRRAIGANPRAQKTFRSLSKQDLFALAFRTNAMKTREGRSRKIAALVAMLARGETIVPSSLARSSIYPATTRLVGALKKELAGHLHSKGTIRFPLSGGVPTSLIGRIAKLRAAEAKAVELEKAAKKAKPKVRKTPAKRGSKER
jgi:uncharacterized protein YdeI (YjbR/CyaY-like superfamily)